MGQRQDVERQAAAMHPLWGGQLCLDFANTVEPRGGPPPLAPPPGFPVREELTGYPELVAWALHAGTLGSEDASRLLAEAARHPDQSDAAFRRAIDLREAIYRVFWSTAHGATPDAADLAAVAREHAVAFAHAAISSTDDGYAWTWPSTDADLLRPLWPIARSAADLLTEGDLRRVKVCPGPPGEPVACGWLFYDATKNRGRHWCSMTDCGGATKARRQTRRRRAARRGDHG